MQSIECKLSQIGPKSTAIIIPRVVGLLFQWGAGHIVKARLLEGGPFFETKIRSMSGGRSIGVIIPASIIKQHGLKWGDHVSVPFHDWTVLRREGGAKREKKRAPAKRKR